MLGTGAAMVTKCFNTCFTISDESGEHFLVDGGGGNGILVQMQKADIKIGSIHNVFLSHNHSDHILGLVWIVRYICQEINKDRYEGNLNIYAHPKSLDALRTICTIAIQPKLSAHFDKRIIFNPIHDGYECDICGRHFRFFDLGSTKELQHGFVTTLHNGKRLAFLGDEPLHERNEALLNGTHIIMQEAYCLYAERETFNPYKKHHGTVLDSCKNAQRLGAETTILFHTEGRSLDTRKQRYTAEGQTAFSGNLFVPDDLDVIEL